MFSKRLIAIMIAIMMVISLSACSGTTANDSVLTETVATATDASAESSASSIPVDCTEAFESEPSPVPLDNGQRIAPVDNSCISVAEGEHGVFVTEGKLYALFGDNTDSLYGNIITVEKEIHPADDADTVILNVVSEPQLIETDVKQAIVFATGTAEEYYAGSYYASLLYIKNDGTLWVKGSNRNGMFGNVDTRSGAKLLDGVMKIYRGDHSVSAITEAGELYRWDFNAVNADDLPILIAVNVIAGSNSDLYYLNENGELCANNGENNVVLADNVRCFTTDIYRVAATFNDGTAKLYVPEMSALQGGELIFAEVESSESAIAYCGLGGSAMFALKENGSLYSTAQSEWENMNRSLSYVVSAFSYGGSIFAVTEDLQLHYLNYDPTNGNLIDAKVIAEDVVLCYPLGGNEGCLYVTSNGSLHSWSSIGDSIDFKLGE